MRVLFAVDPTQEPERLVARAKVILDRFGATVDLLHVPSPVPGNVGGELAKRLEAAVMDEDREIRLELERWLAQLAPADRRGQCLVRRDANPAKAIVDLADGYELVVVGTHGRSGLARVWLGSVAERVVRTSPVPVLVLHEGGGESDRMLVAVDLFDPIGVVDAAALWAQRLEMSGDAVWVRHQTTEGHPNTEHVSWRQGWREDEREAVEAWSAALTEKLASFPEKLRGVGRVELGDPVQVVTEIAATGYGLVVVGTHGRTGIAHLRMGSVAEHVARHSPVPVLVVRPSADR
ncbi:MAG: universal stress protein [Alphaproteobacteria bacterium]|nr:universal stress protein [Alphaproteobacteria bacterium]MCB9699861.1 universal stress protein [Alphaproteobacteria bacterium]